MQAVHNTELIKLAEWTLRIRKTEHPNRLLVLIHGYKGDENSMWVFSYSLPSGYWIIAPRALYEVQDGGYSWRPSNTQSLNELELSLIKGEIDQLNKSVKEYALSIDLDVSQYDVMGFSQGAAIASLLSLTHPEDVDRVALLAGFIPPQAMELIASRPLAGKHFFVSHGTLDEMVPVEQGRLSVKLLEKAGAKITYCEEEIGHKVSAGCLRQLIRYFGS